MESFVGTGRRLCCRCGKGAVWWPTQTVLRMFRWEVSFQDNVQKVSNFLRGCVTMV